MKEITFGIPSSVSLGDFLTLNPTMRQNKNSTLQFIATERTLQLAELYLGVCKVQFVEEDEIIYQNDAILKYGNKNKSYPFEHACINFLNIFEYDNTDCLPEIKFYDFDINFAKTFLSKYKKPICVNMVCGNFRDKTDIYTQHRMMPFEVWQQIINKLNQKGYDVLQFGTKNSYVEEITGVNYIENLSIRQTAACFNYIKNIITLDSGGGHQLGAISKANVYCLHPPDGPGYYSKNYHYDDRFWKKSKKNCFYDNFRNNFNNLIEFLNNA